MNNTKEKAPADSIAKGFHNHSNQFHGNQRRYGFDYNRIMNQKQCKICQSDWMRYADPDGACQDCIQRREHKMRQQRGGRN